MNHKTRIYFARLMLAIKIELIYSRHKHKFTVIQMRPLLQPPNTNPQPRNVYSVTLLHPAISVSDTCQFWAPTVIMCNSHASISLAPLPALP